MGKVRSFIVNGSVLIAKRLFNTLEAMEDNVNQGSTLRRQIIKEIHAENGDHPK